MSAAFPCELLLLDVVNQRGGHRGLIAVAAEQWLQSAPPPSTGCQSCCPSGLPGQLSL
jgi:hypothetical protein